MCCWTMAAISIGRTASIATRSRWPAFDLRDPDAVHGIKERQSSIYLVESHWRFQCTLSLQDWPGLRRQSVPLCHAVALCSRGGRHVLDGTRDTQSWRERERERERGPTAKSGVGNEGGEALNRIGHTTVTIQYGCSSLVGGSNRQHKLREGTGKGARHTRARHQHLKPRAKQSKVFVPPYLLEPSQVPLRLKFNRVAYGQKVTWRHEATDSSDAGRRARESEFLSSVSWPC